MWLGDISSMDERSRAILKSFNVESDHQLINSEFYQAQMNCIFSEPITESQILIAKRKFIENIKVKYEVDISHLEDECVEYEKNINRPVVFTEKSVSGIINSFDKVLVEGFSVSSLKSLYEKLYTYEERSEGYEKWQSIKFIEALLDKWISDDQVNVSTLISPLYVLHDYRIYLDHLLSKDKKQQRVDNIIKTLNVRDFSEQELIYHEEIERLNRLFQLLVLLSM